MYIFKYGGKDGREHKLIEAQDLVVVGTEGDDLKRLPLSVASRSLLSSMMPVASFPESNVTIYQVHAPEGNPLKKRNDIRRNLKQETGVRFAGRVLKDAQTGTIYLYTENFFVKFHEDISRERCEELIQEYNMEIVEELVFATNAYFTRMSEQAGLAIFNIANRLLEHQEVESCHPEMISEKKHKAIYPMQWHLHRTIIRGQVINENVQVEEAWEQATGKEITIAIIDDGVDYSHEEFGRNGKVVAPRDTIMNTNDGRPRYSSENHGTACAGVACAKGDFKASGVAPDAHLMPIRSGGLGSIAEAKAFAWAADNGADVISCSWGPRDGYWRDPNDPLHTTYFDLPDSTRMAMDYATNQGRNGKGCSIVWAAGNGNEDVKYDGYASYERVIAVAACNDRGRRSVYSDFGKAVWCCFPSSDIFAPELDHPRPLTSGIWTTDRIGESGYNQGGVDAVEVVGDRAGDYTASFGGTSSACPGVAGVIALMYEINPELSWQEVKQRLRNSCDRIDEPDGLYDAQGHSIFYGYGRINALKAVRNAQSQQEPLEEYDVYGLGFFNLSSIVQIREGQLTRDAHADNRLVGLALRLEPFESGLSIRYRVNIARIGMTNWVSDGSWVGTMDRRRKLIGLSIDLEGPLADQYTVQYSAKLNNRNRLVSAADGEVCGTSSSNGPSIEEIKVEVKRK